jgi:hypothetical protein
MSEQNADYDDRPMRWRKKPVEIEAWQVNDATRRAVARWCGGYPTDDLAWDYDGAYTGPDGRSLVPDVGGPAEGVFIRTLEGVMFARNGDWVIRGVQGEFYPCKPDIFAATYEAVDPAWCGGTGRPPLPSEVENEWVCPVCDLFISAVPMAATPPHERSDKGREGDQ